MIPPISSHVKCVLRNGAIVEGIVEAWSDDYVQLISHDADSIMIIPHPKEDIMLIKIALEVDEPTIEEMEESKTQLETQFQEVKESHHNVNDPVRNKTLAELKIELNKEEKNILAAKLKGHHAPSAKGLTAYSYPGQVSKLAKSGKES